MSDEYLQHQVDRARRMLARLVRTIGDEHNDRDGPPGALAMLLAAEMLASFMRRLQRDIGVERSSVGAARKLASEIAGIDYEGSGIGPSARIEGARIAAVRASEKPDSAFPADVARDAEEAAIAAITRIMRGG